MSATEEEASQNIPYDIFLSYARHDKKQAQMVFDALGRQGWSVFMDKEIPNAESWEQYLKQQLEQVPSILVLWSPAARESLWDKLEAEERPNRQVLVHGHWTERRRRKISQDCKPTISLTGRVTEMIPSFCEC